MTTSPSRDEFLSTARRELGFLVSEFRFTERLDKDPPNPFSITYQSSTAAITIEGIQWGFGVQIILTCLRPAQNVPALVPLWAVVQVRAPEEPRVVSGQLAQLALDASLLRRYAADVLSGDFTVFPAAMRVVEEAAHSAPVIQRKLP